MEKVFTLCSPEEFISKSNNIIKPPFENGYNSIDEIYKEHAQKTQSEPLANALSLASEICSMILQPNSINKPFKPCIQLKGSRSSTPDDFATDQLEFIEKVYIRITEPLVKARFADLLWLCVNPKKIVYAKTAIQSYLILPIDDDTWISGINDCWERCIRLAKQINNSNFISTIEHALQKAFAKDYSDSPSMNLSIANLISNNGLCKDQLESIVEKLFNHATHFYSSKNYQFAQKYLFLAKQMFKKLSKEDRRLNCLKLIAECFESEGDSKRNHNPPKCIAANYFYQQALQAYRDIPAAKREDLNITLKLAQIKNKIADAGAGSLGEMQLIETKGMDISEAIKNAQKYVGGKESSCSALLHLTNFPTPKHQELQTETIKLIQKFPASNLCDTNHMANDGRIIAKTPGFIDIESKEGQQAVTSKTIQYFLENYLLLKVKGQIIPALNQILSEFRITEEYLKEICCRSPVVPEDREFRIASGLWHGFEYRFGDSIYILAPQVEHLVRTMLKNIGVQTSNTDKNSIENENGLTTLLNNEHIREIFSEDLLFELKALFTEPVGANLRNNVSHGLLDDKQSNSLCSVYSWWLVLRLVIRSLHELESGIMRRN